MGLSAGTRGIPPVKCKNLYLNAMHAFSQQYNKKMNCKNSTRRKSRAALPRTSILIKTTLHILCKWRSQDSVGGHLHFSAKKKKLEAFSHLFTFHILWLPALAAHHLAGVWKAHGARVREMPLASSPFRAEDATGVREWRLFTKMYGLL